MLELLLTYAPKSTVYLHLHQSTSLSTFFVLNTSKLRGSNQPPYFHPPYLPLMLALSHHQGGKGLKTTSQHLLHKRSIEVMVCKMQHFSPNKIKGCFEAWQTACGHMPSGSVDTHKSPAVPPCHPGATQRLETLN